MTEEGRVGTSAQLAVAAFSLGLAAAAFSLDYMTGHNVRCHRREQDGHHAANEGAGHHLGMGLRHLVVLGTVAGVGFAMALFIAQLAFADSQLLAAAKLGVLVASAVAATLGLALGRRLLAPVLEPGTAQTADEAERSTEA